MIDPDVLCAMRAKFVVRRNKEPEGPTQVRLSVLIVNMDGLIRDPTNTVLERAFLRNCKGFEDWSRRQR